MTAAEIEDEVEVAGVTFGADLDPVHVGVPMTAEDKGHMVAFNPSVEELRRLAAFFIAMAEAKEAMG